MQKSKHIVTIFVISILFSCSKKTVMASNSSETKSTGEVAKTESNVEAAKGKIVYENSCGRCHELFPATKHNKEEWTKVLNRMAPKARIDETQKSQVYAYLTSGM